MRKLNTFQHFLFAVIKECIDFKFYQVWNFEIKTIAFVENINFYQCLHYKEAKSVIKEMHFFNLTYNWYVYENCKYIFQLTILK